MSLIRRRGLLAGIGAMLAVPAIIRTPGLLMPVKPAALEPVIVGADFGRPGGDKTYIVILGDAYPEMGGAEHFLGMFQGSPLYGRLIG